MSQNKSIQSNKGDCEIFPSPFTVFLNANNVIYLAPDNLLFVIKIN